MGWDFSQIKITEEGMVAGNYGYNESWIYRIADLYTTLLDKPFPLKVVESETYWDNCINSMQLDKNVLGEFYKEFRKDLTDFPLKDLKEFKNIEVSSIIKWLKDNKSNDLEDNPGMRDFSYTVDECGGDVVAVYKLLNDYQDVFKDILKYATEGYIYYYIVNYNY